MHKSVLLVGDRVGQLLEQLREIHCFGDVRIVMQRAHLDFSIYVVLL